MFDKLRSQIYLAFQLGAGNQVPGPVGASYMKERMSALRETFDRHRNEPLGDLLRRLNAVLEDVKPEEMTVSYIRTCREKKFADDAVYDQDASVGGHVSADKKFVTRRQARKIKSNADRFLSQTR